MEKTSKVKAVSSDCFYAKNHILTGMEFNVIRNYMHDDLVVLLGGMMSGVSSATIMAGEGTRSIL